MYLDRFLNVIKERQRDYMRVQMYPMVEHSMRRKWEVEYKNGLNAVLNHRVVEDDDDDYTDEEEDEEDDTCTEEEDVEHYEYGDEMLHTVGAPSLGASLISNANSDDEEDEEEEDSSTSVLSGEKSI